MSGGRNNPKKKKPGKKKPIKKPSNVPKPWMVA